MSDNHFHPTPSQCKSYGRWPKYDLVITYLNNILHPHKESSSFHNQNACFSIIMIVWERKHFLSATLSSFRPTKLWTLCEASWFWLHETCIFIYVLCLMSLLKFFKFKGIFETPLSYCGNSEHELLTKLYKMCCFKQISNSGHFLNLIYGLHPCCLISRWNY